MDDNDEEKALDSTSVNSITHQSMTPYQRLQRHCEEKRHTHAMAERYFTQRNRMFVWPSILLTSGTSVASFLASAIPDIRFGAEIIVGCVGSVSALVVALSSAYAYRAKAECHALCAESFDRLIARLFYFGIGDSTAEETREFMQQIEQAAEEIQHRCKYLIPPHIEHMYKARRHEFHRMSLQRNLRTIVVQHKYNDIVAKLERDEQLTADDLLLETEGVP